MASYGCLRDVSNLKRKCAEYFGADRLQICDNFCMSTYRKQKIVKLTDGSVATLPSNGVICYVIAIIEIRDSQEHKVHYCTFH